MTSFHLTHSYFVRLWVKDHHKCSQGKAPLPGNEKRSGVSQISATQNMKPFRSTLGNMEDGMSLFKNGGPTLQSSWWLNQPLWKICLSKLDSSSPGRGENKKIFETTNQQCIFFGSWFQTLGSLKRSVVWVATNMLFLRRRFLPFHHSEEVGPSESSGRPHGFWRSIFRLPEKVGGDHITLE